uniref:Uncharacterized protein n=1 Tax=Oryza meridionalis TaxID=40149 RepID=A0A0E0DAF4_9ORYZ
TGFNNWGSKYPVLRFRDIHIKVELYFEGLEVDLFHSCTRPNSWATFSGPYTLCCCAASACTNPLFYFFFPFSFNELSFSTYSRIIHRLKYEYNFCTYIHTRIPSKYIHIRFQFQVGPTPHTTIPPPLLLSPATPPPPPSPESIDPIPSSPPPISPHLGPRRSPWRGGPASRPTALRSSPSSLTRTQ